MIDFKVFNISPVFYNVSNTTGKVTKIFIIYIANDYKENTYYVNSPYNELNSIKKQLTLQGYSNLCIELPYLELKSLKELKKQKNIIEFYDIEKVLYQDWNYIDNSINL